VDLRLPDFDVPEAGLDRPPGLVAVANDLASSRLIRDVGVIDDPGGDLGLDGLGQEASSPVGDIVKSGGWR
jgi:hypothetical protein